MQNRTAFYGFAENKETEINKHHPVLINAIHITTGQMVSKGDLLMEVNQTNINQEIEKVDFDISSIKVQKDELRVSLTNSILELKAERRERVEKIKSDIQELLAQIEMNKSLLKDLKSVKLPKGQKGPSPIDAKLAALQKEMKSVAEPYDVQIANLNRQLRTVSKPSDISIEKLESEKSFYEDEQAQLSIYAPSDGLIGTIHCKEGENISAFTTLISFYEQNPTEVKGFVHESLILHVNIGDTLDIASSLHPTHTSTGIVVALGSRIIEIPERLRKFAELKNYGREVLIQIPPDNFFLQKEKVVLSLRNTEDVPRSSLLPSWRGANRRSASVHKSNNTRRE